MMTDLTTGKSVLVLATVIGCFAILWPRIFYPMMQTTFSLASPLASQDDADNQNLKPNRVRGHPPVHAGSGPGGRIPPRLREIVGDGRPDIDPLTTITMEDGRPFTRPGVRGPATRPQQKAGGTMSIVMPVYTIGIVGFFLYTILKLVFKNKQDNEEDQETDPRGYSSTMKKLGVDPAKLSKLRECVYNSGQSCQDIDDYSELIAKSRMKAKDTGRKKSRSDLGKPRGDAKPAKKSTFQGLKKQEEKQDQSDEEAVYQNLREAEEKVKLLLREVEKQRLELANNKHHQSKNTGSDTKMRDVKEELEQKLDNLKPDELQSNAKHEEDLRSSELTRDPDDDEETDDVKEEESRAEKSEDERFEDEDDDEEWEERNSDCEDGFADETVLDESADNEENKILQILDLLIREKVQSDGPETETTKTILRLRKELQRGSLNAAANKQNNDKKRR